MHFKIGNEYSRRIDIHKRYGGQSQGGISTPAAFPLIFLFTSSKGELFGYEDGWADSETFVFTGEGQVGDMSFERGNRAVRNHVVDEKALLLFEAMGHGKPVRFIGQFTCATWEYFRSPDVNRDMRTSIRFHLVRSRGISTSHEVANLERLAQPAGGAQLAELRERAYAALKPPECSDPAKAARTYRARSEAVRDYVLARAGGRCELTGERAPFLGKDGNPYLETHHTHMLSDGGPDHPRWVAAISPNAHREIHYGAEGAAVNALLMERLGEIEPVGDGHS